MSDKQQQTEQMIFQFLNAAYRNAFGKAWIPPDYDRAMSLMAAELSANKSHTVESLAEWAKHNV